MNNDQLKKFMKENINLHINDCLQDIKDTDVEVLPCTLKKHSNYGKYIRYGLYAALGLSIFGSSSITAYNYVTPETFINIEISSPRANLSESSKPDDFMMQINLNSFDKVIDVSTNMELPEICNISHMDYKKAYPIVIDFIQDITDIDKSITFTVISNDQEKNYNIEEFLKEVENHYIHLNEIDVDTSSNISIGQQKAINLILRKTNDYSRKDLEKKSLNELLEILFKL